MYTFSLQTTGYAQPRAGPHFNSDGASSSAVYPKPGQPIDSLRASEVPISRVAAEVRGRTGVLVLNRDIYNSAARSRRIEIDGLSQVHDLLCALDGNAEFAHKVGADASDRLKWLTFATRNALAQFSRMSFVLLMDATYKTNRFGMPLLLFSSVDPFGRSYVVACSLLTNETAHSYLLALASFKELFGSALPVVNTIVTDQDNSLISAINSQFPSSTHQLCRGHLEANVKKNFPENPLLGAQFSRFTLCQYESVADQLYADMLARSSAREGAYLRRLYALKEKYVEAWTSRNLNLGIRSTQRAAGMNAALKRVLRPSAPLAELFHAIRTLGRTHEENSAYRDFLMRDRQRLYYPLVSSVAGQVPAFILDLMERECLNIPHLIMNAAEGERVYLVIRTI